MTRLAVILGALALTATASSVQAGLKEGAPDVHTDGDPSCQVYSDGPNNAGGTCCTGGSDGSVNCTVYSVTSIPSADFRIVPRRKFPPYVLGAKPFFPPEPTYLNRSRWPLVPTVHVQRPLRFASRMIAHPPEPAYRFGSSGISHAAFVGHPALVGRTAFTSHLAFASHASLGRSFGRLR